MDCHDRTVNPAIVGQIILQANKCKHPLLAPAPVRLASRSVMSKGVPTHLIGTQAFLPALLAYIRNIAAPASLPLDHVIFQSVLLCLIAGDKHLILRTPEEDVGLVVRLAVWVGTFRL